MARVVGRARPVAEGVGTGMKLSEAGIFIIMGIIIVMSAWWYFAVYKHSPEVALGNYINAIKSGKVDVQYDLIDGEDKKLYLKSEKEYEKTCPMARGYTERISNYTLSRPVPDSKDPDPSHPSMVSIEAYMKLRGQAGKNLIDNGQSADVNDKYVLRKDAEGEWKIVLSKGWPNNLVKQPANPPGDSF